MKQRNLKILLTLNVAKFLGDGSSVNNYGYKSEDMFLKLFFISRAALGYFLIFMNIVHYCYNKVHDKDLQTSKKEYTVTKLRIHIFLKFFTANVQ